MANYLQAVYADFGVSNEEQLENKIISDSETIPCIICHRELKYTEVHTLCGDPYCQYHWHMYKG